MLKRRSESVIQSKQFVYPIRPSSQIGRIPPGRISASLCISSDVALPLNLTLPPKHQQPHFSTTNHHNIEDTTLQQPHNASPPSNISPSKPQTLHPLRTKNSLRNRTRTTTPPAQRTRRVRASATSVHWCIQHTQTFSHTKSRPRHQFPRSVPTQTTDQSITSLNTR